MSIINRHGRALLIAAAVSVLGAQAPFAQTTQADTALVPFIVNVAATVTAVPASGAAAVVSQVQMSAAANSQTTMRIPLTKSTGVLNGTQKQPAVPVLVSNGGGKVTLNLPAQSYKNAEISLYAVNGRQMLSGKAAASEAAKRLSARDAAPGVYLLSVKGSGGNAFTSRIAHSGGELNIAAVFSGENAASPERMSKKTEGEPEPWTVTVSAAGYVDSVYTLRPVTGANPLQNITLNAESSGGNGSYTLTVNRNPTDGGTTIPWSGLSNIAAGSQVEITAAEASGYTFANWTMSTGGGSTIADQNNSFTTVTVNGNVTVTANFTKNAVGTFADDRDGKTYKKVKIGTQVWMTENLNYQPSTGNSWCYGNSADSCKKYGRLYDWGTARAACPSGWHLPLRQEWDVLMTAAGGSSTAGKKLKSASGGYNGTNDYGFSALPGGTRDYSNGSFYYAGRRGFWWTATEYSDGNAYNREMLYDNDNVSEFNNVKSIGFSVRCVEGDAAAYAVTFNANGGSVSPASGTTNAGGRLASLPKPTRSGYEFKGWYTSSSGGTEVTTETIFSAAATIYAQWIDPYEPVTIGGRKWMKRNLNVATTDSWCYMNSADSCAKYGRLYSWAAAMTACPSGWKLPSRGEWESLVDYAGGDATAGKKLRARSGWNSSENGTDNYGFSALPGGRRELTDGFEHSGRAAYWWTATESEEFGAYAWSINSTNAAYDGEAGKSRYWFSVRCVAN